MDIKIRINKRKLLSLTGIFVAITLLIAILAMSLGVQQVPRPQWYPGAYMWEKNSFFWLPYHLADEPPYSEFELGGKAGIWFLGNYIRIWPYYLFALTILYWAVISIVVMTIYYYAFRRTRARREISLIKQQ